MSLGVFKLKLIKSSIMIFSKGINRFKPILLVLLIISYSLFPQKIRAQEPTLVIENGSVIVGNNKVFENASVIISGNKIKSITKKPVKGKGISRIDADGKTVMPGLIDAHVHLGPGYIDSTKSFSLDGPVYDELKTFLRNGVTTIRSTGGYWPMEGQLRDKLLQGEVAGPRLITSGPVLTIKGAHPATTVCSNAPDYDFCRSSVAREFTTPGEARKVVRELAEEGVDFIKLVSDSINFSVPHPSDRIINSIIEQGHREELKVVGHVASDEDMISYAHMDIDGFVHPPQGPESEHHTKQLGKLLSRKEIPVTTTLSPWLFFYPTDSVLSGEAPVHKRLEHRSEHLLQLSRAGVMIVAGTDWRAESDHPALQPGTMMITEMKMLRWGGMSQKDIIKTATANAAQALEMDDQIGTLESGKFADIIIVNGNPLQDISALKNITKVIKNGTIIDQK